jgi:SNF2 family DNA or RNA helicase
MAPRKSLTKIKDETDFYQHQVDAVRWGVRKPSFLLADEMGLGKSLSAATVAAVEFERRSAKCVLIVVPAFLRYNWAEELELHTNYHVMVLAGTPLYRRAAIENFPSSGFDIMIVSYETLVNDKEYFDTVFWDIVIVDEAHYIKNPSSKRSKAVRTLRRHRGFLLTGSPMLNRPDELWALLNFMDPHRFKNRYQFRNRFCVMGGFKMKEIVGVKNKGELRGIMDEYMLRRLKRDCLDLPDKQVIRLKVDLHPDQKKIYDKMENELMLEVPDDPDPMEAQNILVKMLRLKQICGTPAVFGLPDDSYKLDRMVEMCVEFTQDDPDDRTPVVVWTQFRDVMDVAAKRLAQAGIPTWQLHGDVKQQDRMKIIHEWAGTRGTGHPGVLLIMLQMGMGLNLTAANKAIFIDSLYVPKMNEQAEDRIHRIGASTTQPVQIFYLITRQSVEERIEQILRSKRKLFNELIETDPTWKAKLIAGLAATPQPIAGAV